MTVTDAHIHVQPWWELKSEVLEVIRRGRTDLDEIEKINRSPAHLRTPQGLFSAAAFRP